ncbi:MAG: hypothetical protein SNJ69_06260, partial [Chloroflexaceae bacterium]
GRLDPVAGPSLPLPRRRAVSTPPPGPAGRQWTNATGPGGHHRRGLAVTAGGAGRGPCKNMHHAPEVGRPGLPHAPP